MLKEYRIKICFCIIFTMLLSCIYDCQVFAKKDDKKDYGVFLSVDASELEKLAKYRTVVIDAQYFSKKDIEYLKKLCYNKADSKMSAFVYTPSCIKTGLLCVDRISCQG